jgi:hypothetical protein
VRSVETSPALLADADLIVEGPLGVRDVRWRLERHGVGDFRWLGERAAGLRDDAQREPLPRHHRRGFC